MVGGYTAILLVRQPNGVENSIRRQCSTLNEAEKWLDEQMERTNERPRETGCARTVAGCERENGRGCMESGELAIRDADTGEILSAGQLEQAAPFQRTEWKGIDLTRAGFSAMPDTAGCWSDANGTLWLITGGDGIDGHIFRLKEEGREWECAPCSGITVRMLHEWARGHAATSSRWMMKHSL